MNRSGRGFGLTGVAIAVAVMIITAVFSTSARTAPIEDAPLISSLNH
ncbi:hypothetical protein [Alteromonas oceanisediminis]|nr:hypothetical protein [Alteromonas oceanisediminis]MBT0584990.1 hypothetical protein [Alteromonas oceanisediminis]